MGVMRTAALFARPPVRGSAYPLAYQCELIPSLTKAKRGSFTKVLVRTPPEKPKAKTLPAITFLVTVTVTLAL